MIVRGFCRGALAAALALCLASAASGQPAQPLVPPHSYHPFVAHFPIALFLFGGLLDGIGARKGRPDLRQAGFLNLLAGMASVLFAIVTGFAALYRSDYLLEGALASHFVLAWAAAFGMLVSVGLRRRSLKGRAPLYWGMLVLTLALVAAAGHLGADFAHGD